VLKPGVVALFTFFLVDGRYNRAEHQGARWDFDRVIEGQPEWYWSSWFKIPEQQIGVSPEGIRLLAGDDFILKKVYPGWWPGRPGAFLQDTLMFQRVSS